MQQGGASHSWSHCGCILVQSSICMPPPYTCSWSCIRCTCIVPDHRIGKRIGRMAGVSLGFVLCWLWTDGVQQVYVYCICMHHAWRIKHITTHFWVLLLSSYTLDVAKAYTRTHKRRWLSRIVPSMHTCMHELLERSVFFLLSHDYNPLEKQFPLEQRDNSLASTAFFHDY